jgi:formylglycine-generating enzyme required for sulfatase activity
MRIRARALALLPSLASLLLASTGSAVSIDWVAVGNPGNANDNTGYGSVGYAYGISKYEVTYAQYTEFLNAIAKTDTYSLYAAYNGGGVINRTGSSGSYVYSVTSGYANRPVFANFYNSLRFANWLQNGQPTGLQSNSTTEDGAYTITASGISANSITRNAGATIFLTSENEWYKAAYYNAITTSYFDYPAGSDTATTCAAPTATPNRAACNQSTTFDVGSYTGSPSPYGTYDQGGNLWEWDESISGSNRIIRGGAFNSGSSSDLAVTLRGVGFGQNNYPWVGFRLATTTIPEPDTAALELVGLLGLAAGARRRR